MRTFPRVQLDAAPMGVSGATAWNNGSWQIVINASEPLVRQRFSSIHELKHVIDYPFTETAYPPSGGMNSAERREKIADHFAACVLMPRAWVKSAWCNGVQDIGDLARLFDVSREAMRYRLTSIGLILPTPRCEVAA